MKFGRSIIAALTLFGASHAMADGTATTVQLDTVAKNKDVHWIVAEVSGGLTVSSRPVFGVLTYGKIAALSIPFSDNDGYWVARAMFKLPANASNPTLTIATLGVDDRTVVRLNGHTITGSGTTAGGNGFMTFEDGGDNVPQYFPFASGAENRVVTTGFRTGFNKLEAIVNNTKQGIFGAPVPPGASPSSVNSFGMTGSITYSLPAP